MILASVAQKFLEYYSIVDQKIDEENETVILFLNRDKTRPYFCRRCGEELTVSHGKYHLKVKSMPIFGMTTYLSFAREKRFCPCCKKVRSEVVDFISDESPHITKGFSYWLGKLCEISPVASLARTLGMDPYTTWRIDKRRMEGMLNKYRIPKVRRLSVDEVYVRKKPKHKGELRSKRFFTVISDLDRKKVLWVSEGRNKNALDEFFLKIGPKACKRIKVVAGDQFEGFYKSVKQYCPKAIFVWDRFHLMQNFNKVLNEERKKLHASYKKKNKNSETTAKSAGRYRYIFLKKSSRRTKEEEGHMDFLMESNFDFTWLEIIKEKMAVFFDCENEDEAWDEIMELKKWINERGFDHLRKWHDNLLEGWNTLKNYFTYRVTSALSEGMNNVIKTQLKKGYGYRNMEYLKLKVMQQCGFLNSKYFDKHGNCMVI